MINMQIFLVFIGLLVFSLAVQSRETTGIPGVDYPNYLTIPKTSFKCSEQKYIPGFYADMDANCQVYHFCSGDNQETFLCPVGSTFNQAILACDSWYSSNCSLAPLFYNANSGTLLEGATRIVPMLIKLRNRSQNKTPVRADAGVVYEKISSLYGNNADTARFETRNSDFATDELVKSSSDSNFLKSDSKTSEEIAENPPMPEDILTKLKESVLNSEPEDGVYYKDSFINNQDTEGIPENLVYDPVTEQYYVKDSFLNDWQQNLGSENFDLNYGNLVNKYGLVMDDTEASDFSENVPLDFKEMGEMDDTQELNEKLSKRLLNLEQPSKRVRRKPIYTVVREDTVVQEDDDPYSGVVFPSSAQGTAESTSTEVSPAVSETGSEQPSEASTAGSEVEDITDTDPPFEMTDELRYPFTPLNHSEVPMTSEEFEHAILTELVIPKIDELDLPLIGSEWQQNQESADRAARDLQSDEQYTYVDGMPDGYAYSQVYNSNGLTSESEQGNEDVLAEDPVDSDTYVVIPDETDVLDSEDGMLSDSSSDSTYGMRSEQQNKAESDIAYDLYNTYSSYMPNYESPEAYETVSSPQFSDAFEEQQQYAYIDPETQELVSPHDYADSYVADEATAFNPVYNEALDRCTFSAPGFYCKQPVGYAGFMYGTQSENYDGFYSNPHLGSHFSYEVGPEWPSELSSHVGDSSNTDASSMPFWISADPNVEAGNERVDTDVSRSTSDFAYSSEDAALGASEDLTEISQLDNMDGESSRDSSENQEETYYILDLDADENSESPDVTESDQIVMQQSSQPGEPVQPVGTSDGNYLDAKSSDTAESSLPEENLNLENVNSAETLLSSVKLNPQHNSGWQFSPEDNKNKFEKLPEMERVGHPTAEEAMMSDSGNKYLPNNKFINNMEFSETMDFGSFRLPATSGQQSNAERSFTPPNKKNNEFLHRSGNSGQPNMAKLSVLQERIKSLKQGKFGAFKKYVSSTGNKN